MVIIPLSCINAYKPIAKTPALRLSLCLFFRLFLLLLEDDLELEILSRLLLLLVLDPWSPEDVGEGGFMYVLVGQSSCTRMDP